MSEGIELIERSVIATIVANPFLLEDYDIKEAYFDEVSHRKVINAVRSLQSKGKSVDLISVDFENSQYKGGMAGQLSFLHNYTRYEDYESFESYQSQLVDRWKERELLKMSERIPRENMTIEDIRAELERIDKHVVNDEVTSGELVKRLFNIAYEPNTEAIGASTGIKVLDDNIGGLRNNKLFVVAGRPGMGKTDFALQILHNASQTHYVNFFSLEMDDMELGKRLISKIGKYKKWDMLDPESKLSTKEKERWPTVLGKLSELNMSLFIKAAQSIDDIKRKTRISINKNPDLKHVVIIDYLQLMELPKGDNEHKALGMITKAAKQMAKEFDIPVVLLSQLNREVEKRQDKRPTKADLRGSGSIEEDADNVLFLYRESEYDENSDSKVKELILDKSRDGATGTMFTYYDPSIGKYEDLTVDEINEYKRSMS